MLRIRGAKITESPTPSAGCTLKSITRGIAHASVCLSLRGSKSTDVLSTPFELSEVTGETLHAERNRRLFKKRLISLRPEKLAASTRNQSSSIPPYKISRISFRRRKLKKKRKDRVRNRKNAKSSSRSLPQTPNHRCRKRPPHNPKRGIAQQLQQKRIDVSTFAAVVLLGGSRNLASETESQMPQKDGTALVASSTNLVTMATQSGTAAQSTAKGGAAPHAGVPNATTCCTPEAQNDTIAATTAATVPNVLGATVSGVSPYERQQLLGGNLDLLSGQDSYCLNPGFFKSLEHSFAAKILLDMWFDEEFHERLKKANPEVFPSILGKCREFLEGNRSMLSEEALASQAIGCPEDPTENFIIRNFLPQSCKVVFGGHQWGNPMSRQRPCEDLCVLYPRQVLEKVYGHSGFPPPATGRLPKNEALPYYLKTLIWKSDDSTLSRQDWSSTNVCRDYYGILDSDSQEIVAPGRILWARYVLDKAGLRESANEISAKHEVVIDKLLDFSGLDRRERGKRFNSTFVKNPQEGLQVIAFLRSICEANWSHVWYPLEEAFVQLLLNSECIHLFENNKVPVLNHKCNSEATNGSKECICDFWRYFLEAAESQANRSPPPLSAACTNYENTRRVAEAIIDAAQYIREMCELEETDNSQAGSDIFFAGATPSLKQLYYPPIILRARL